MTLNGQPISNVYAADRLFARAIFDVDLPMSVLDAGAVIGSGGLLELAEGVAWQVVAIGAADLNGTARIRLAAGRVGTHAPIKPKSYQGASWRAILEDAIRESGEVPGVLDVTGNPQRYIRTGEKMPNILADVTARFAKKTWRVLPSGAVSVYSPTYKRNPAQVLKFNAHTACAYLDFTPDLEPGQTLELPDGAVWFTHVVIHTVGHDRRESVAWGDYGNP